MVETVMKSNKETKGHGLWKLNCNLLKDFEYTNQIENCIESAVFKNKGTDAELLWETIKWRGRSQSVKYSSFKTKKQQSRK